MFDSGVGGLSVLQSIQRVAPHVPLLYVADSAHAPYGERDPAHVLDRALRITAHLVEQGAAGIVVACNTATAITIARLRERWPTLPIVGIEPGLKPAVAVTRNKRIGVMATSATLASDKFRRLRAALPDGIELSTQACPGLAQLIERGDLRAPALREAVETHCAPLRAAGIDVVVLGCTHYAFVRHLIEAVLGPEVQVVDTAAAVARHALRRFGAARDGPEIRPARLQTTGAAAALATFASSWLAGMFSVETISGL